MLKLLVSPYLTCYENQMINGSWYDTIWLIWMMYAMAQMEWTGHDRGIGNDNGNQHYF